MQLIALALAATALLGQAPQSSFHWDIPDPKERVEVPGIVTSNGLPMKLAAVRSGWRSDRLLQYFATSFQRAGLYLPPVRDQPQHLRHPQLTALDPRRKVSFTVILQQNEDGSTTVIMGEAHLGERQPTQSYLAPLFPGAQGPVQTDLEGMRTLTYLAPGSVDEVKRFYAEQLVHLGFHALDPGRFQKDDRLLRLEVSAEGGSARVVILDGLPADQSMDPGAAK